ncbi:hypothetical protein tb265_14500 [Gemmatimonadetes bacterium T265]|nr:hypothetical protein tb265_14500 [Gemmatimonadetes bacterium T265]
MCAGAQFAFASVPAPYRFSDFARCRMISIVSTPASARSSARGPQGLLLLAVALSAAACSVSESKTADAAAPPVSTPPSSGGPAGSNPVGSNPAGSNAVAPAAPAAIGWKPSVPATIAGIPASAVQQAIARQLAGRRPASLDADAWQHVQRLYKAFNGAPLWMSDQGPDKVRSPALLKALVSADQDALNLERLPLPELARALQSVESTNGANGATPKATAEQIAAADVMFTSAYAALAEDLLTGQVDPKQVEKQDWFISRQESRIDSALVRSLGDPDVSRGIDRMRPQEADYRALRQQLVQYRALAAKGDWPRVPAGRALKPGDADSPARLSALRARLSAEGLLGGAGAPDADSVQADAARAGAARAAAGDSARDSAAADSGTPDRPRRAAPPPARRGAARAPARAGQTAAGQATYDAGLAGGVAAFQARHGIAVDSLLGPETVNALNVPVDYRMGQIAANLERYRWLPRTLGARYVIANVPAFSLEAWDGGKKALEMKVVVGKDYEDKKTPVFADSMQTVVFRPYWNITDEIAAKETWPKIHANRNYMAENDLETFREAGRTHLRQKPGPKNSLGLVKFLFPNSFNIYFHDTPEKQLFAKDVRGFSHGCIRLEKPAELASWVLGWPVAQVEQAMNDTTADNRSVPLPQKVPVYIAYFTTYLKNGQLYFGNDLYARDQTLVQAMTAKGGQSGQVVQAVDALRKLVAG